MFNYSFFFLFFGPAASIYRFLVVLTVLFIFNYVFLKKYGAEIFLVAKVFFKQKNPLKQGEPRTFLRCEMLDGLHDKIGNPGTDQRADGNAFEKATAKIVPNTRAVVICGSSAEQCDPVFGDQCYENTRSECNPCVI